VHPVSPCSGSFALRSRPAFDARTPSKWSNEQVKAIPVLVLLAVAGFTLAACGSSKRAVSEPITITGTTTISNVTVGTLIRCQGGPAAKVPHWFGASALNLPGVPGQIALNHRYNGSVTVSCRP